MQNPILFISLHSNTNKNHSTRLTYATKAHKNIASEQLGMGMGICVLPPVTPHWEEKGGRQEKWRWSHNMTRERVQWLRIGVSKAFASLGREKLLFMRRKSGICLLLNWHNTYEKNVLMGGFFINEKSEWEVFFINDGKTGPIYALVRLCVWLDLLFDELMWPDLSPTTVPSTAHLSP